MLLSDCITRTVPLWSGKAIPEEAMTKQEHVTEIFDTLRHLVRRSFPIECSCGEVYGTLDEFLAETTRPEREHGLFEPSEYDDPSIANLLRQCPRCGSTLMAVFSERRDASSAGLRARALFGTLVDILLQKDMSEEAARKELLTCTRGGDSAVLRKHLVDLDIISVDELITLCRGKQDK